MPKIYDPDALDRMAKVEGERWKQLQLTQRQSPYGFFAYLEAWKAIEKEGWVGEVSPYEAISFDLVPGVQQFLEAMDFDLSLGHMGAVDDALERGAADKLLSRSHISKPEGVVMITFQQFLEAMDLSMGYTGPVDDAIERGTVDKLLEDISNRLTELAQSIWELNSLFPTSMSPDFFIQQQAPEISILFRMRRFLNRLGTHFSNLAWYVQLAKQEPYDAAKFSDRAQEILNNARHTRQQFQQEAQRLSGNQQIHKQLADASDYLDNALQAAEAVLQHLKAQGAQ